MKKIFLILALALVSVAGMSQGVNFQELTLEQAIAKAKAEDKLVFIDTYTDWCGPCRLMTNNIFPMKEMGDYFNPKFISLKFNAEKGEEGPAVKTKFGITAYPTFVILNGEGELIHMFAGGVLGLGFIDKVEESFNPEKAFGELQRRFNAGERDKKLVANYIQAFMNTHTGDATKLINEFESSLSEDEIICDECLFLFDDLAGIGSKRADFIIKNVDKFRNAVGREKTDKVITKKFGAYYAGILGKQRAVTVEDVDQINTQVASLNLTKSTIIPIYQKAVNTYLTKDFKNGGQLCKMITKASGQIESGEMDILLYFTIPSLKEMWSQEQLTELAKLTNNDAVKSTIAKLIK